MIRRQRFLRDQRVRFTMAQISWRRTNQFGDFVRVLELRAVHFDYGSWVAKQNVSPGFNDASLTGTGRPEKQQVAYRPPGRIQSSAEHLIQVHQRLHAFFLTHDLRIERRLKFQRVGATFFWVQWKNLIVHDRLLASRCCSDAAPKRPLPGPNCSNLTWIVDCKSRKCTSSSFATAGDSEICRAGGNRSAKSRWSALSVAMSFCTSRELGSARLICWLRWSRSARQFKSTNGCFLDTSRTTVSVIFARSPSRARCSCFTFPPRRTLCTR